MTTDTNSFGPYRLDELLGRGGMGDVYRAYDVEHRRTVALKRLAAHLADDPEFQERFRREAHNVAQLRSPHIIPIHTFGEIDGQLYIDMRFVEGGDLDQLVRTVGALPVDRAVNILEQVASALDEAHHNGLVHRDVKPSNVLLDAKVADFCYLADFGITKLATTERSHSLTRTGALLGSLAYTSPEQFDGAATTQSDVYSLTCVFFELLTGHRPYEGEGLPALLHSHMTVPPPRPSAHHPEAALFDDVVATGMAKVAADRFESAGELAHAARTALEAHRSGLTAVPAATPPADEQPTAPVFAGEAEAMTVPRTGQTTTDLSLPGGTAAPAPKVEPERAGGPRPRWLVPLAAAAVIAAVVVTAFLVTQRGGSTEAGSGQPPAAAPVPATATATTAPAPAAAPGPVLSEAVFTGRSSGNELTIAVGIKDGRAVGYVCDGDRVEAWLEGSIAGDRLTLQGSTAGTQVTAVVDQRSLLGSIAIGGTSRPFSAQIAIGAAGLYESRRTIEGITTRIGWIVLPDGSQVGVRRQGEDRMPAPHLDVTVLETVDQGQVVRAERLSGASTVILR